jgi:hypothetical protein
MAKSNQQFKTIRSAFVGTIVDSFLDSKIKEVIGNAKSDAAGVKRMKSYLQTNGLLAVQNGGDLNLEIPASLRRAPADPAKVAAAKASVNAKPVAAKVEPEPYQIDVRDHQGEKAFFIDLGDDQSAGPFDTKAAATKYRDRHFTSKVKTGRKLAINKTAGDAGGMTEKYAAKTVTLVSMPGDGDKLAAQAEGCMEALRSLIGDEKSQDVSQGALVAFITKDANSRRDFVNTTQSPKRIWDFYRKALTDAGYISVAS